MQIEVVKMKESFVTLPETVGVALEVIAGVYGNNDDRIKKLKEAGYNPSTIQSCVNELCSIIERYEQWQKIMDGV